MKKIKRSKLQYLRYISLISVVLFFCFIPLSNWYANNKIAFNLPRLVGLASGEFAGYIYSVLDSFYTLFEDPVTAATSNSGSMWAFSILGIPLSDPLGLISEVINSVKFPMKYFLGGLIPLGIAILLGRVFCSWICPMSFFFSITTRIKKVFKQVGIPILELKIPRETRIFVFWFGLVVSYFMGMWVWHFILPYITFSHEVFSIVVFNTFTVGVYYFVAVIILDIGLISGEFCNSVCPTGWLLAQIGRVSLLKLKADKPNCPSKCRVCHIVCPVDLFPKEDILYSCHLCFKCVDNCPKQHIKLDINKLYQRVG
jgi:ferredoxin-type protein NapH